MRALASQSYEAATPLKKRGPQAHPVPVSPLFPSASFDSGVVQRKAGCACGGDCPNCQSELGVQAKLKVGAPNDKYEQEADRVAEHIVSGGSLPSTRFNHAHNHIQRGMTAGLEEEETEENAVQRKPNSGGKSKMPSGTESYIRSLGGGGRPLSHAEAQYYEPRFGQSFHDVRIHTGAAADSAARSINARAFTLGKNIAFANGEYDSGSDSGRKLMAHELTHTLQQSAGVANHIQRGSAGVLGGSCCNPAPRVEWALVGNGVWKKLERGQCTGTTEDCDGMTCGGGFYHVDNLAGGRCSTPHHDDATYAPRRWTPTSAGASAHSPTAEGSTGGDTPPNYGYDSAPTTPCPNGIRTISVDFVRLFGATHSSAPGLAAANTIYSGCCIRFVAGATPPQETQADTQGWLGGNTDVDRTQGQGCGNVGGEEQVMFDRLTAKHGLSSRMRVFYVASYSPTVGAGYSIPPYCATGAEAPYVNIVVLSNSTNDTDDLAHEFGHILLNDGNHSTNNQDLMFATNVRGTNLSATQCATAFDNA
jgi:hypothetical protein